MSDRPDWMNNPANYPHSAPRRPEHSAWCPARCNLANCERPHACVCAPTADNETGPATDQTADKDPSNKAEEGKQ